MASVLMPNLSSFWGSNYSGYALNKTPSQEDSSSSLNPIKMEKRLNDMGAYFDDNNLLTHGNVNNTNDGIEKAWKDFEIAAKIKLWENILRERMIAVTRENFTTPRKPEVMFDREKAGKFIGVAMETAVRRGNLSDVKSLFRLAARHGMTLDDRQAKGGAYSLSRLMAESVTDGRLDIIKEMIKNGVDPNQTYRGRTHLSRAVESAQSHVISFLIHHGADPNQTTSTGKAILHESAASLTPSTNTIIQCLLDNGAAIDTRDRIQGNTPLHTACSYCNREAIYVMYERGVEFNAVNDFGETPLAKLLRPLSKAENFHNKLRLDLARDLVRLGFILAAKQTSTNSKCIFNIKHSPRIHQTFAFRNKSPSPSSSVPLQTSTPSLVHAGSSSVYVPSSPTLSPASLHPTPKLPTVLLPLSLQSGPSSFHLPSSPPSSPSFLLPPTVFSQIYMPQQALNLHFQFQHPHSHALRSNNSHHSQNQQLTYNTNSFNYGCIQPHSDYSNEQNNCQKHPHNCHHSFYHPNDYSTPSDSLYHQHQVCQHNQQHLLQQNQQHLPNIESTRSVQYGSTVEDRMWSVYENILSETRLHLSLQQTCRLVIIHSIGTRPLALSLSSLGLPSLVVKYIKQG